MKYVIVSAVVGSFLGGSVVLAAAQSVFLGRPKGRFSATILGFEYDPEPACYRPRKPFSKDRFARDQYIADAKRYVTCLDEAAQADARLAQKVVGAGLEKANEEFLADVRRGF